MSARTVDRGAVRLCSASAASCVVEQAIEFARHLRSKFAKHRYDCSYEWDSVWAADEERFYEIARVIGGSPYRFYEDLEEALHQAEDDAAAVEIARRFLDEGGAIFTGRRAA